MNEQFFLAQTLNRQLGDREQFADFDKKYIGLELQTAPLSKNLKQTGQVVIALTLDMHVPQCCDRACVKPCVKLLKPCYPGSSSFSGFH